MPRAPSVPEDGLDCLESGQYRWQDDEWMQARAKTDLLKKPVAAYEVHLGSWLRAPNYDSLSYRELAVSLVGYVKQMGYTHIELMPIMEHPFSGSWGYQVTGYFAPTAATGRRRLHVPGRPVPPGGIGVIVDWVPAHFPKDGMAWPIRWNCAI